MTIKQLMPRPVDVGREAVLVILGAVVAAVVIGQMPAVRAWMKAQWDGVPGGLA